MYTLIGYKEVNFKAQDGSRIAGVKLYFTYDDKKAFGHCTETVNYFKRDYTTLDLELGSTYDICYNKFGKIQELRKVG